MRRTGAVYKQQPVYRYITNAGYIKVKDPSHPLAASDGTVFEHRYVKHKELGDGDHPCFWCGSLVEWQSAVVDHLNEAKSDNRAENLVYSCNNCNRARGAMLPLVERLRPEALEAFIDQVWSHWVRANG
jgi:5-methylcytosine-specific restriction endonuclease McrA